MLGATSGGGWCGWVDAVDNTRRGLGCVDVCLFCLFCLFALTVSHAESEAESEPKSIPASSLNQLIN